MTAASSRRAAVKALGILSLAAVAIWQLRRAARLGKASACGPKLAYRANPSDTTGEGDPGNAVWLALAALPVRERGEVVQLLEDLVTALEARATPGLVDLTSEDVRSELEQRFPWLIPMVNAAGALVRERWWRSGVDVRIFRAPASPDERLLQAWSEKHLDELSSRARLAAWAVSWSIWIGLSGPEERERVATRLRNDSLHLDSPIALVLDVGLLRRSERPANIAKLVARLKKHKGSFERSQPSDPMLEILLGLADVDDRPLLSWLEMGAEDLLIVPRLGSLARREAFRSEIAQGIQAVGAHARYCEPVE